MEIVLLVGARPYILPERCAIELHDVAGLELDAATASKLAGHANPNLTMRVYADDFRKATERNADVLARAAERGFGT